MGKQVNTGTSLAVSSGAPVSYDDAGYAAMTWVGVGEVLSFGEFGSAVDTVNSQPIATGVTEKHSGFINYGSISLGLERDVSDNGQALIISHVDGLNKREILSVKITLPDGSINYLETRAFSYTTNLGSANQMIGSSATLEINKKPIDSLAIAEMFAWLPANFTWS